MSIRPGERRGRSALAAAVALAATAMAHAENHALILWIGDYDGVSAHLPGIEHDARNARRIAAAMGVPPSRITELSNSQLKLDGLSEAMRALIRRIHRDDRVFIYFSGHGTQVPTRGGSAKPCAEGLVTQDRQVYFDQALVNDLSELGAKASQVVMLNDSCFSGGDATRDVALAAGHPLWVPKSLPPTSTIAVKKDEGQRCGVARNALTLPITRNIEVVSTAGAQLLYVAAAGADEVSYATDQGSPATQAWTDCLTSSEADSDHSGAISGEELRACAQARLDRDQPPQLHQTITLTGNAALPVTVAGTSIGANVAAPHPVNAPRALTDLRAAADSAYRVTLRSGRSTLRIGHDLLEFTVTSNRDGYLYVLQVGSDGKTFNLLFPNRMDPDNHIAAGTLQLPHPSWRMRSGGPEGTTHLLALVSSVPRNFAGSMDATGSFAEAPATSTSTRNILLEATGANEGGGGRYGASEVVRIGELP